MSWTACGAQSSTFSSLGSFSVTRKRRVMYWISAQISSRTYQCCGISFQSAIYNSFYHHTVAWYCQWHAFRGTQRWVAAAGMITRCFKTSQTCDSMLIFAMFNSYWYCHGVSDNIPLARCSVMIRNVLQLLILSQNDR
jgi:hypothetical protein